MIKFCLGMITGGIIVAYNPEVLNWFVTSGMRDNIVSVLEGV